MRSFKVVTRSNGGSPVILTIRADDFTLRDTFVVFRRTGFSVAKTGVQEIAAFHLAPGDYVVEEETTK